MSIKKQMLAKGLKYVVYTIGLMFLAPIVLFQAFKNQEHAFYIPVLVIGFVLAIAAIAMGFYSIQKLMEAIFYRESSK